MQNDIYNLPVIDKLPVFDNKSMLWATSKKVGSLPDFLVFNQVLSY
jgi:hypothetical protein